MWPIPDRTPERNSSGAGRLRRVELCSAFSLLELLVSMVLLALLMFVLIQTTTSTSKLWRGTTDKIKSFQNARSAFETITQTLAQATLNTYYEYFDASGTRYSGQATFTPNAYDRYSELHFLSGPAAAVLAGINRTDSNGAKPYAAISPGHAVFFQAPLGYTLNTGSINLDNTLNAVGYFVEFASDKDMLPGLVSNTVTPHYRYRLVQFLQPTENLDVYLESWASRANGTSAKWFKNALELGVASATKPRPVNVLADNILFLIIRPKPDLAGYTYDSRPKAIIKPSEKSTYPTRHQLPPRVAVTLVAIDEASAIRLENQYGATPPLDKLGLANLFQDSTQYDANLRDMKSKFADAHINYRIFETEVLIRTSKWTTLD